jgi:UDP-glucose 4-epimerase
VSGTPDRVFVTGGAGFIGGSLVPALLGQGSRVTVFDDLSGADDDWWIPSEEFLRPTDGSAPRLSFIRGDVRDLPAVESALTGHDLVIHLAAHTDIAGGAGDPSRDLHGGVVGTWNVLEAMRRRGVRALSYASSGTVYGYPSRVPTPEDHGPLLPESYYAAAKLAGEALISGFAAMNGWRAIIFRFGNTIGARSNHGVVHDLVVKLLRDPTRLALLGDGQQRKPYVAVEDVVAGMLLCGARAPARPVSIYNIGTAGTLSVARIAELVIESLGLDAGSVEQRFSAASPVGGGGWPGDTPLVDFDTSALRALGWEPRWSGEDAVRRAARGTRDRLLARGAPLLTASERRAAAARSVADGLGTPPRATVPAGHAE